MDTWEQIEQKHENYKQGVTFEVTPTGLIKITEYAPKMSKTVRIMTKIKAALAYPIRFPFWNFKRLAS